MGGYLDLLRDVRLRTIWLGETLNSFGSALTFWALTWALYRLSPEQPLLASTVLGLLSVTTVGGSLLLGGFLDRWDRRRTLLTSNLLLAGLTAGLPLVFNLHLGLWPLYALIAVLGLLRSLPAPALSAALPGLTDRARLPQLQALFNLTWMTGELLAPALAGLLITLIGPARVFWIDALTFLLTAFAYFAVRFPAVEAAPQERPSSPGWWADFLGGWRLVGQRPPLIGVLVNLSMVNAFYEMFGALLLPRVGERLLGAARGPSGVGVLDACTVATELVASLWLGKRHVPTPRQRWLIFLACTAPVASAVVLVYAPSYPVALLCAVLSGLLFAPLSVLVGVYVSWATPEPLLGRVNAVRFFCTNSSRPLAMLGGGALLAALGTGPLALWAGGLVLLANSLGYWYGRQGSRA